jgi:transcriptional regulator with XRE-family HTH domain
MTPAQCRAARGLIDWSQVKLAEVAAVAVSTVTSFEQSSRVATPERIQAMRAALERAGVEFINGDEPGVKLRKPGMSGW